jgi:hypothetical protein
MAEMNRANVNLGNEGFNPFTTLANKAGSFGSGAMQHARNKDLATHKYGLESQLSAQEHTQASTLSAQESEQRMKENAANNRHEIKKIGLIHNHELVVKAVDHNNGIEKLRTESTLRTGEENARSNNALQQLNVAHTNATEWLQKLHRAAAPGTKVDLTHGDVKATYTTKEAKPKAEPKAPQHTGPDFVGMPGYHITTPAPAAAPAAPEGPKPTVKRGPGGRMVSLKEGVQAANKQKPAKKSAPAKGQPTVARGPGGRMVSLKKQA